VSKDSRINVNFAEGWSGRWESNPRPKLGTDTSDLEPEQELRNAVREIKLAKSPRMGSI
jgi:hypothetical protein